MVEPSEPRTSSADGAQVQFVLNALTVSGGVKEVANLCSQLSDLGVQSELVTMWQSDNPIEPDGLTIRSLSNWIATKRLALVQLPVLMWAFSKGDRAISKGRSRIVFTHYSTFALAWLVPAPRRFFFVQDIEWMFVSSPTLRAILKWFILLTLRSGTVFTTNQYLSTALVAERVRVPMIFPIWGRDDFVRECKPNREIDVVMVLRHGQSKRLDLYRKFVQMAGLKAPHWRLAVISPEVELCAEFGPLVFECMYLPTAQAMADLYSRSKVFLMLSEHEGFGLPPLEAMGAGCVPVCRDSGGIRTYLGGDWQSQLVDLDADVVSIFELVGQCVSRKDLNVLAKLVQQTFMHGMNESIVGRHCALQWLSKKDESVFA